GIAPLRAVAGLEGGTLARLAPGVRWAVAVAWTVAALAMAWWTFRPAPGLVASGLGLWALSGLVSRLLLAGAPAPPTFPEGVQRQVAGAATGLDRLREEHAPVDSGPGTPPGPGLWSSQALAQLLEGGGGRPLGMTPTVLDQGGRGIPAWFAVRRNGAGPELVAIAEDRLAAGGAPVSYREGDPEEYPGVVAWRHLDQPMAMPDQGDTVVSGREGGVPLGGPVRRLLLAWGTQTPGILAPAAAGATLHWALPPRERAHRLLPMADWGEARPCLVDGTLHWVVEGWLTGEGAPLAPPVPWDGGSRRYLRPAFIAVVAAGSGATRLYLHPTADPLAAAWAGASDGAIVPAESLPPAVRALPMSDLDLAVKGYALTHGPFGLFPESGPALLDSLLPRPVTVWTPAGPMPQLALTDGSAAPPRAQRLDAVLLGGRGEGPRLIRWADGAAPRAPRGLEAEWQRFATWEQLQDSLGTAGARLLAGPVRYDIGPRGTVAVQPVYAMGAPGVPALVWVELARGDRLGAARSPAAAWSNLRGESAPLVPAPDLPDALGEARRWAARADSLLRAGDLEGFGRAFSALKRVLGTP
ncbi:MAG TPA: UPF0182 family protein, partial [Gemmatimonadales bacterium]|nr:UPF0182 family protein [Gemmatimonadales bacterium]